jgi:hypothetical protein
MNSIDSSKWLFNSCCLLVCGSTKLENERKRLLGELQELKASKERPKAENECLRIDLTAAGRQEDVIQPEGHATTAMIPATLTPTNSLGRGQRREQEYVENNQAQGSHDQFPSAPQSLARLPEQRGNPRQRCVHVTPGESVHDLYVLQVDNSISQVTLPIHHSSPRGACGGTTTSSAEPPTNDNSPRGARGGANTSSSAEPANDVGLSPTREPDMDIAENTTLLPHQRPESLSNVAVRNEDFLTNKVGTTTDQQSLLQDSP